MAEDGELQRWLAACADPAVAGVPGFPDPASVGMEALSTVVTTVIYVCSALHSAVNYPQYEFASHPANMPCLLRRAPSEAAGREAGDDESDA